MNTHYAIFLFLASAPGSGRNTVAGGGSFIEFPVLLFAGVPPIPASATNTFALWAGAPSLILVGLSMTIYSLCERIERSAWFYGCESIIATR